MRIRNIKPEITKHEGLADLSRDHRLFFIYLWMLADTEGRLEDRPRRIKADLFPYDDDLTAQRIDEMLGDLEAAGFLHRYEADGRRVIWIPSLPKHQTFSTWESKKGSRLPPPPDGWTPKAQPKPDSHPPEALQEDYSSPTEVLQESDGSPTEALHPDIGHRTKDVGHRTHTHGDCAFALAADAARPTPGFGPDDLAELWNETAPPECPRVRGLSDKRRIRARQRLREHPEPEFWRAAIEAMHQRPFLRGRGPRGWRADFDWLMQPDSATRVLEGCYADEAPEAVPRPPEQDGYRFFRGGEP